jgi:hypothetical protein
MIESLREKYKGNDFMTQKLEQYLQRLPILLQAIEDEHIRRETKKQEISILQDQFIQEFMNQFSFFYIPQTELFIEYVDGNYTLVTEDDITHAIMERIQDYNLSHWKYKINISIIKKVKEKSLWNSIPNVYTIKRVQLPFLTKEHCRYFLSIIGDVILGKRDNFTYFLDLSYKPFLKFIGEHIYLLINKSIADIFKQKYYDHKYETCRILTGKCSSDYKPTFNILNLIVVATHFSTKYGSAEGYVCQSSNEFQQKVYILQQNTPESLLYSFIDEYTQKDSSTVVYKDLYFLWKTFLHHHYLPFVISQQNFKVLLAKAIDIEGESCLQLSIIKKSYLLSIKHFWDKYISLEDDYSYDYQELFELYNECSSVEITIEHIKEFLLEYPSIVKTETSVLHIKCSLWDKEKDIHVAMEVFKYHDLFSINMEDKYAFYCCYQKHKRIVSYEYFKNVLYKYATQSVL